jgi:3',5'-cyclic AMP phosphodiesterase CpdA
MKLRSLLIITLSLGLLPALALWVMLSTSRDELGVEITARAATADLTLEPDPVVPSGQPSPEGMVRFAVVGDSKGGNSETFRLAEVFADAADEGGLDAVLLAGDNLKDRNEEGVREEFRDPFGPLLDRGIPFFAALGNHDLVDGSAEFHCGVPEFHMRGRRYFTVSLSASVEVFLLDSCIIKEPEAGGEQLVWLSAALEASRADVRIVVMHHPIYGHSDGRDASEDRRALLEPLFIEHGVQLVFQGHQHIYERIATQQGVHYFITGAGGGASDDLEEEIYPVLDSDDRDASGMLWEIEGNLARFQTLSSEGTLLDEGVIEL